MKKLYNSPILFKIDPPQPGEDTGRGSAEGDNFMTWEEWSQHHPQGTPEEYEEYCLQQGMPCIIPNP